MSEGQSAEGWLRNDEVHAAACISCNACRYTMYVHPGKPEPGIVSCVYRQGRGLYRQAQRWAAGWVKRHVRIASRQANRTEPTSPARPSGPRQEES